MQQPDHDGDELQLGRQPGQCLGRDGSLSSHGSLEHLGRQRGHVELRQAPGVEQGGLGGMLLSGTLNDGTHDGDVWIRLRLWQWCRWLRL